MIRVLVFLAVLVVLAFLAGWVADQPGGISLTIDHNTIEMPLWAGVLAVLAAGLALLVAWWIIRFGLRLPQTIGFAARARRRARGFTALTRGMIAVGAGDPRSARRHAEDAGKFLGNEPLALLLKAQAAQMAGDRGSAEGAFRKMLDEPETRVLGLRGLFVEARRKGDGAAARAYAAEAARISPSVVWAGEALLEYQCADGDWTGALATLERGAKGLDKATLRRQRAVLLAADALARSEREPDAALSRAQEAVKLAPDLVPAAALAGRLLARRGELRRAAKTIEAAWKINPHPDLAAAYVALRPGDSARDRMARAERLLAISQHHAEARIATAAAAIDARDFRKARTVLEPLLRERPSVRVCLLMADIAQEEHQDPGAVREWLGRAARAPRDPAWIADGVITETWAPVSPVTGRLDALVWGTPVERIEARETMPGEAPAAPGDRAILPVPASDEVLADADEPEVAGALAPPPASAAAPAAAPAPATASGAPAGSSPEAPVAAPATVPAADGAAGSGNGAEPPAPPDPARAAPDMGRPPTEVAAAADPAGPGDDLSRPAAEPLRAAGSGAGPAASAVPPAPEPERARRIQPTPVVFPMPAPPDDPGTASYDGTSGTRSRFLQ